MVYILLGRNIQKCRKTRGITQEKLSEKINISPVFMSQIETASRKPSLETVVNISDALNTSLDVLIKGTVDRKSLKDFIDVDLTREQLNIISYAFKKRNEKEISAMLKSFYMLARF